jgi:hypothetical protein
LGWRRGRLRGGEANPLTASVYKIEVSMRTAKLINSIGLVLDIIGAVLLWRYVLPPAIRRDGAQFGLLEEPDEAQIALAMKYDKWGR